MGIRHRTTGAGLSGWIGLLWAVILVPVGLLWQGEPQVLSAAPQQQSTEQPNFSLEKRADIYMARKAYADAADYYQRALKQDGFSNARLWNKLGIAYQQLQNYHASRKAYNQAMRRQKNYAEPLNNIGTTYFMQNKKIRNVKNVTRYGESTRKRCFSDEQKEERRVWYRKMMLPFWDSKMKTIPKDKEYRVRILADWMQLQYNEGKEVDPLYVQYLSKWSLM